jgi:hypothetical protein
VAKEVVGEGLLGAMEHGRGQREHGARRPERLDHGEDVRFPFDADAALGAGAADRADGLHERERGGVRHLLEDLSLESLQHHHIAVQEPGKDGAGLQVVAHRSPRSCSSIC